MSILSHVKVLFLVGLTATLSFAVPQAVAKGNGKSEPIQFDIGGEWGIGEIYLGDSVGYPRSFTIPDGATLVIRYITCNALIDPGSKVFIHMLSDGEPGLVFGIIPDAGSVFFAQERQAVAVTTEIYLGISPSIGPAPGNEISIYGQRDSAAVSGLLGCTLSGELTL